MKRFKELRSEITEENSEGGGFGYDPVLQSKGRSANPDVKPVSYDDEFGMHAMNSFITAFCAKSYVDPRSALYLLRAKLNLTGVDFDLNRASELSLDTQYQFPLKRYGGTFGTSPSHDLKNGFEVTNGFNGKNFVLKCKITAVKDGDKSGIFMIEAHIEEV